MSFEIIWNYYDFSGRPKFEPMKSSFQIRSKDEIIEYGKCSAYYAVPINSLEPQFDFGGKVIKVYKCDKGEKLFIYDDKTIVAEYTSARVGLLPDEIKKILVN